MARVHGRLWVYVGGDSGFESFTTLHYLSVGVLAAWTMLAVSGLRRP
jgi:hypothetical protein